MTRLSRLRKVLRILAHYRRPRDWWILHGAWRRNRKVMCPPDVWERVDRVPGFLTAGEASLLVWAARHWPVPGPVVEVGSLFGRSTICLASAGAARTVECVDKWDFSAATLAEEPVLRGLTSEDVYARFLQNMAEAQVASQVRVHRGRSVDIGRVWSEQCAILLIDGSHEYGDVCDDLATWTRYLLPNGLLLVHDVISVDCPDVKDGVTTVLKSNWRIVARSDSLIGFVRRAAAEW